MLGHFYVVVEEEGKEDNEENWPGICGTVGLLLHILWF